MINKSVGPVFGQFPKLPYTYNLYIMLNYQFPLWRKTTGFYFMITFSLPCDVYLK
jgi:hypothetical protein